MHYCENFEFNTQTNQSISSLERVNTNQRYILRDALERILTACCDYYG